jgi:hypothetical protein
MGIGLLLRSKDLKNPPKCTPQLGRAIAFVPPPMRDDNPLWFPGNHNHTFNGGLYRLAVTKET